MVRAALAILAVGLGAAALWISSGTVAAPSSTVFHGVDQIALQKCIARRPSMNCEAVVPGLAQCMQKQLPCNQAADAQRKATFGPARPATDFGAPMTQAEAAAAAIGSRLSTTPPSAREMSYGAFLAWVGQQPDPDISLGRLVWVVTVHAPIMGMGFPGPPQAASHPRDVYDVYTVVIDAASRQQIELIYGRALVTG